MDKGYSISVRIKEGMWKDAFPPFGAKIGNGQPLERISATWGDMWSKVEAHDKVCKVLGQSFGKSNDNEKVKPVSLEEMHKTLDDIENWIAQYGNILTYPSSSLAWKKAIKQTMEDNDLDSLLVLSAAFPEQFKETISGITLADNRSGKWLSTIKIKPELDPKAEKDLIDKFLSLPEGLEKPVVAPANEEIKPIKDNDTVKPEIEQNVQPIGEVEPEKVEVKKIFFTKESTELSNYLIETLTELSKNGKDRAVNREMLDSKLKSWVNDPEHNIEMTDFFEEQLCSAIVQMPMSNLDDFSLFWSSNKKLPMRDALSFLTSPKFWGLMKYPDEKEKEFILDTLLPSLLTISNLKFLDKYTLGKEILKPVKKNEEVFRSRLNFWCAIGGSPTESKPRVQPNDDLFVNSNNIEEISLNNWIIKQKNDMWTKELYYFITEVVGANPMDNLKKAYDEMITREDIKRKEISGIPKNISKIKI